MILAFLFLFGSLLFVGRAQQDSGATLKQLVGKWRYDHSIGTANPSHGDLMFTISADGGYRSSITNSFGPHSIEGNVVIRDGLFILTATNRDNVQVSLADRQTIVRFDGKELVTRSEGSTVDNVFRKEKP
jgi:hypothetical protein